MLRAAKIDFGQRLQFGDRCTKLRTVALNTHQLQYFHTNPLFKTT